MYNHCMNISDGEQWHPNLVYNLSGFICICIINQIQFVAAGIILILKYPNFLFLSTFHFTEIIKIHLIVLLCMYFSFASVNAILYIAY